MWQSIFFVSYLSQWPVLIQNKHYFIGLGPRVLSNPGDLSTYEETSVVHQYDFRLLSYLNTA